LHNKFAPPLQQRDADGVIGRTVKKKEMMGNGGANAELS
jgi:hypothetical protein